MQAQIGVPTGVPTGVHAVPQIIVKCFDCGYILMTQTDGHGHGFWLHPHVPHCQNSNKRYDVRQTIPVFDVVEVEG